MSRYMDVDDLLKTLEEDYDLKDTVGYQVLIREIKNAKVVARSKDEWWLIQLDVQGRRIDKRFKDRPISKEKWVKRKRLFIATIWLLLILGAIGLLQTWYYWMH